MQVEAPLKEMCDWTKGYCEEDKAELIVMFLNEFTSELVFDKKKIPTEYVEI